MAEVVEITVGVVGSVKLGVSLCSFFSESLIRSYTWSSLSVMEGSSRDPMLSSWDAAELLLDVEDIFRDLGLALEGEAEPLKKNKLLLPNENGNSLRKL